MTQAPHGKIMILAAGFQDEADEWCRTAVVDTSKLCAHRADSSMILHCVHRAANRVVVAAKDAEVLII